MLGLDETESIILSCGIIVLTTLTAGCMSGLTLSLFSLDETCLRALAEGPVGTEQKQARRVLGVIQSPHWLLVTLLLTNAAAIESMPMVIDSLLNPAAAIAISVVLVLIFGEVIPQACFIRHALRIGSLFAVPLRCLMILTSPVSWTVAKLLDAVVGHREAVFFRRRELREFLLLQQEMLDEPLTDSNDPGLSSRNLADDMKQKISEQELSIMLGALSLSETTVMEIMKTRIEDVVSLDENDVVDQARCEHLFTCGFSRILVHAPGDYKKVTGYIVTKTLITLIYKSHDRAPRVKDLVRLQPHVCSLYDVLGDVYQSMQSKSCHIAVVQNDAEEAVGILSAHDIMEHIHRKSFVDETDLRQGKPMQMIMKSWHQVQWRKQLLSTGGQFGSSYNNAVGSPGVGGPASYRHLAVRATDGEGGAWDSTPNRSFSRYLPSRISQPLRRDGTRQEKEMLRKPPSSPTCPESSGGHGGYGSLPR